MSSGTRDDDSNGTEPAPQHATREQLRALAHPLRLEIMERVMRRGTARAADIAADLDLPANSVSYHLRILARGDVIEEAPDAARDRRDRVWRMAQISFLAETTERRASATSRTGEYLAASGAASLALIDWMRAGWSTELARRTADGAAPARGLGDIYAGTLRLSPDQAEELDARVQSILAEFNRLNRAEDGTNLAGDPDSGGTARDYRVLWTAIGDPAVARDGSGDPAHGRTDVDDSSEPGSVDFSP
ncbi:helix-turn-helix domain-containing protein [Brachybacterium sp. YJGR34]|uniref:winged helix-turn-helix domain-containing protein n=1 Tax=Brachybacterium sp. YJGR34 TaxID=2059911 RepID=UPI0018E60ECA|nr:helix-turn-helix domain-containing protein [Brachybacterium sp. YJGR34]